MLSVLQLQAFTRNFDLIAERKSVIFHLRELAKAQPGAGTQSEMIRIITLFGVFGTLFTVGHAHGNGGNDFIEHRLSASPVQPTCSLGAEL